MELHPTVPRCPLLLLWLRDASACRISLSSRWVSRRAIAIRRQHCCRMVSAVFSAPTWIQCVIAHFIAAASGSPILFLCCFLFSLPCFCSA
jgi:hypothetical protein